METLLRLNQVSDTDDSQPIYEVHNLEAGVDSVLMPVEDEPVPSETVYDVFDLDSYFNAKDEPEDDHKYPDLDLRLNKNEDNSEKPFETFDLKACLEDEDLFNLALQVMDIYDHFDDKDSHQVAHSTPEPVLCPDAEKFDETLHERHDLDSHSSNDTPCALDKDYDSDWEYIQKIKSRQPPRIIETQVDDPSPLTQDPSSSQVVFESFGLESQGNDSSSTWSIGTVDQAKNYYRQLLESEHIREFGHPYLGASTTSKKPSFLAMVTAKIQGQISNHPCNMLIDTSSELNIMTSEQAYALELPVDPTGAMWTLCGVSGHQVTLEEQKLKEPRPDSLDYVLEGREAAHAEDSRAAAGPLALSGLNSMGIVEHVGTAKGLAAAQDFPCMHHEPIVAESSPVIAQNSETGCTIVKPESTEAAMIARIAPKSFTGLEICLLVNILTAKEKPIVHAEVIEVTHLPESHKRSSGSHEDYLCQSQELSSNSYDNQVENSDLEFPPSQLRWFRLHMVDKRLCSGALVLQELDGMVLKHPSSTGYEEPDNEANCASYTTKSRHLTPPKPWELEGKKLAEYWQEKYERMHARAENPDLRFQHKHEFEKFIDEDMQFWDFHHATQLKEDEPSCEKLQEGRHTFRQSPIQQQETDSERAICELQAKLDQSMVLVDNKTAPRRMALPFLGSTPMVPPVQKVAPPADSLTRPSEMPVAIVPVPKIPLARDFMEKVIKTDERTRWVRDIDKDSIKKFFGAAPEFQPPAVIPRDPNDAPANIKPVPQSPSPMDENPKGE
ncbi:uncharacterized protein EI90DRAFT_3116206 [Cantharellus anzutake]|uniref:uncharacterized protein n=1 Tax=Cantharellus anzutake TaxID=1750568 RepID=UPI00190363D3|nr:uncharacterized protein EI90DRAFT_3116206 [Cantharellus anzutake]KAF8342269.1 hypothetical protein EI90DRAFT_3116206 [Cantharellus anzutake]